MSTKTDDSDYMTVAEFAALPSAAQHAVWAPDSGIDWIAVVRNGVRRRHRAQVLELLEPARKASRI